MRSGRLDDQLADPGGQAEDRRRGAGTPGDGDAPAPAPKPAASGDDRGNVERLGRVGGRAGAGGARPERPAQGIDV